MVGVVGPGIAGPSSESGPCRPLRYRREFKVGPGPDLILEIGIDDLSLVGLDELDQFAQPPAQGLEYRRVNVLPILIRLLFEDKGHFGGDHRHVAKQLQFRGDASHSLA